MTETQRTLSTAAVDALCVFGSDATPCGCCDDLVYMARRRNIIGDTAFAAGMDYDTAEAAIEELVASGAVTFYDQPVYTGKKLKRKMELRVAIRPELHGWLLDHDNHGNHESVPITW